MNIRHIAKIMQFKALDTLLKINFRIFNADNEKDLKTQVKSNVHTLTEYWSTYYNKNNATRVREVVHPGFIISGLFILK